MDDIQQETSSGKQRTAILTRLVMDQLKKGSEPASSVRLLVSGERNWEMR